MSKVEWAVRFEATESDGVSGNADVHARTIVEAIRAVQAEFPRAVVVSAVKAQEKGRR